MSDEVESVRLKFDLLRHVMDERMTRLWAAAEARALGVGGGVIVTRATGIRSKRISQGQHDLDELETAPPTEKPREQRVRRPGAGRKPLTETDPTLQEDLESLVDPVTRGDPESPLRWTSKSTEKLARELEGMGHRVSARKVGYLLHDLGYSLQANKKTLEGQQHPDRNAQFEHINAQAQNFLERGQPVISVDTKKKELVGDFKNGGLEWQPKGEPVPARVHDFVDKTLGKAIPYGIYDIGRKDAWVNVGVDHDTAEFAVASIERNKIEHRLFSQISQNWRGRPLVNHETIVNLIAATTNDGGLRGRAKLDRRAYQAGISIPKRTMQQLQLDRDTFHGEWNYTIRPGTCSNAP